MNRNVRGIIIALVAVLVILGLLVAGYFIFRSLNLTNSSQTTPTPIPQVKTTVLVAANDLFIGDMIGPEDVKEIEVPAEIVPRNALSPEDEFVRKFVKVDLVKGEIILAHNLADPTNDVHDIGFILADDHVLFAFPSEDLISQEDVIKRGDIIDFFVTMPQTVTVIDEEAPPGEEEEEVTQLFTFDAMQKVGVTALLVDIIESEPEEEPQNTPVLDTDLTSEESVAGDSTAPMKREYNLRTYLFALDPQDALLLKYLKDSGGIFDIVLRAPTSEEEFDLTPITEEYVIELFGLEIIP